MQKRKRQLDPTKLTRRIEILENLWVKGWPLEMAANRFIGLDLGKCGPLSNFFHKFLPSTYKLRAVEITALNLAVKRAIECAKRKNGDDSPEDPRVEDALMCAEKLGGVGLTDLVALGLRGRGVIDVETRRAMQWDDTFQMDGEKLAYEEPPREVIDNAWPELRQILGKGYVVRGIETYLSIRAVVVEGEARTCKVDTRLFSTFEDLNEGLALLDEKEELKIVLGQAQYYLGVVKQALGMKAEMDLNTAYNLER